MAPKRKFPTQTTEQTIYRFCIWCCAGFSSGTFDTHNRFVHPKNSAQCGTCFNKFRSGGLAEHEQNGHTGVIANEIIIELIKNDMVFPPTGMEWIKNPEGSKNQEGAGPSSNTK